MRSLADGRILRLRVRGDEYTRLEDDGDWFGAVEWVPYAGGLPGNRPHTMNGAAEVLDRTRYSQLWWQPPTDAVKDATLRKSLKRSIEMIMAYGYSEYVLELCEGRDAYGRPIVTNMTSRGGIEPTYDSEFIDEIVAEMMSELGVEL